MFLRFLLLQIHIETASEPQTEVKNDPEVDFFKDHTTNARVGYGDSPSGTPRGGSPASLGAKTSIPPRTDSGSKLSSLTQENGGSSSSLTVATDSGEKYV